MYTVYMPGKMSSAVVSLRVSADLDRRLAAAARRRHQSRSETARLILEAALATDPAPDPAREARRQSRLVSTRASEQDALEFIATAADLRGWR